MNKDTRQVMVFVIVGLFVAASSALILWRTALPASVNTNPALASEETLSSPKSRERQSTDNKPTTTSDSRDENTNASEVSISDGAAPSKFAAPRSDDPFLAPHALAQLPAQSEPTRVYRPESTGSKSRFPYTKAPEPAPLPPSQPAPATIPTSEHQFTPPPPENTEEIPAPIPTENAPDPTPQEPEPTPDTTTSPVSPTTSTEVTSTPEAPSTEPSESSTEPSE